MKKNLLCMLALAGMSLASCGSDTPGDGNADNRVALQLEAGISVKTRAYDKYWEANDRIGIYMFSSGTTSIIEGASNIPYETVKGDGSFSPAGTTIYYPVDGSNVDFHAWYPYREVEDAWTIDLSEQGDQPAIDLMTAGVVSVDGGTVYNTHQPSVKFLFRHRLSKIVLEIEDGVGITPSDLEGLKVELTGQPTTVTYDPEFNALGMEESYSTITLNTSTDGQTAECIIFPNDVADNTPQAGRELVFTLGSTGEVFYYTFPADKSFDAGERNIYHITVNRTGLEVTSEIEDWNPGNGEEGESGSAE